MTDAEQEELRFDYLMTAAKLVIVAFEMNDPVSLRTTLRSLAEVVAEFEEEGELT